MAGTSDIEWTDATWNPVSGCTIVSPGCSNCYAMRMASRLQAMRHPSYMGTTRNSGGRAIWTGKISINSHVLESPLGWKKPKMVFVNSMSDLFQEGVPTAYIFDVWQVMQRAERHIFQILTKRPERMKEVLSSEKFPILNNVWIGTSVENKKYAYRVSVLRNTPAHIRFVSFEPLLGPIGKLNLENIDWAIVGGESGPRARTMDEKWIDSIKALCERDGTSFFFKQWGGTNKKLSGRIYRGRTWDEFPKTLVPA